LHPTARRTFNRVRALLHQPPLLTSAEQHAWLGLDDLEPPDDSSLDPPSSPCGSVIRCPRCHRPMLCIGSWHAGQSPLRPPERAPP
jgi:hypothetical protein